MALFGNLYLIIQARRKHSVSIESSYSKYIRNMCFMLSGLIGVGQTRLFKISAYTAGTGAVS